MRSGAKVRSLVVVASLVALLAGGVIAPPPAAAAETQFTFFAHTDTHNYNRYWTPPFNQPNAAGNWVSPVNYRDGRAYMRFDVTEKPSNKEVWIQLCLWDKSFAEETCSPQAKSPFSTEGVYYVDLGAPGSWWKKDGFWDWTNSFQSARLMIKDPITKTLMVSKNCGNACYKGSEDLTKHLPIGITAELVVVGKGATLQPLSNWAGCPKTWSAACGSGTPPPPPPPPDDVPLGEGRRVAVIAGSSTGAAGDKPLLDRLTASGYVVDVHDDDTVVQADVEGAHVVLVTSSISPAKVPPWLAALEQPVLNNEAYINDDLGMGANGADTAGQHSLVIDGASPLAGGLSGTTRVSNTTQPFASARAGDGADVVATIVGQPARAAIFAYDTGDAMWAGTAPAPRVAFYFAYPTPGAANNDGWRLLLFAVDWLADSVADGGGDDGGGGGEDPPPGDGVQIAVVAGNSPAPAGDGPIVTRLETHGTVEVLDDDALTEADVQDADLVVITSSVSPAKIPAWLATLAVPVLNSEAYVNDDLGLGNKTAEIASQHSLDVAGGHAIAGDLAGRVRVSTTTQSFGAVGEPGAAADVVATIAGQAGRAAIFAYDTGEAMWAGTAPARRVGFYFSYAAPAAANASGWTLFDNAVTYALG